MITVRFNPTEYCVKFDFLKFFWYNIYNENER